MNERFRVDGQGIRCSSRRGASSHQRPTGVGRTLTLIRFAEELGRLVGSAIAKSAVTDKHAKAAGVRDGAGPTGNTRS
jgi:hypothetical protein